MAPFPLPLVQWLGQGGAYLVYLLIGIAFGVVLEVAGFGYSPKLAAQFYFKDMTVLKVMFTAIVVAMILIFWASALGLLDFNLVWVNPTYLWPGIVGGLIMGAGFIIGGFCPGTSLVAAATLKLDGIFFALGAFFGIFLFGETVSFFDEFWYSSYYGRVTVPDWLSVETGLVVLGAVIMAIAAFGGSELAEKFIGGMDLRKAPKWRFGAAGAAVLAAVGLIVVGQPTTADRWARIAPEKEAQLAAREVQIHPGELLSLIHDNKINLVMLDVRDEADYNRFHILDAQHVPPAEVPARLPELHMEPENTVVVVMSNDEAAATEAWKVLVAESVLNAYILEGGINAWLRTFAGADFVAMRAVPASADDTVNFWFDAALGHRHPAAEPNPAAFEALTFTPKVKLEVKRGPAGGGCG